MVTTLLQGMVLAETLDPDWGARVPVVNSRSISAGRGRLARSMENKGAHQVRFIIASDESIV